MNDKEALEQLGITGEDLGTIKEADRKYDRHAALVLAVKARIPNAGSDEIVSAAKIFEAYLTGNTD